MEKHNSGILELEKELASVEIDAVEEEQQLASNNYAILDNELVAIRRSIPYPETGKYTTGIDWDDIDRLRSEKNANFPWWEKEEEQLLYCNDGSLYSGHINCGDSADYFIMESPRLKTRSLGNAHIVNADDENYAWVMQSWRYPDEHKDVKLSRNITMRSRKVEDVDVVLDKGSSLFADITDAYLRKALIRNKNQQGVQSIIQTIQKKQDSIRSLPVDNSFIVQGCAGSGKTMVLLHRLRYLLYNNKIESDEFVFLVPSFNFKEFIKDISLQFKIREKNILPYQSYYRSLLGKTKDEPQIDNSELVFDTEYLNRVYSKMFMQECYSVLFEGLSKQTEQLIELCEKILNELLEDETVKLDETISFIYKELIDKSTEISSKFNGFISTDFSDVDTIKNFIAKLNEILVEKKKEYQSVSIPLENIRIEPDDVRILNNPKLSQIKAELVAEEGLIKKASIFTVRAHKAKLEKLQNKYDETYKIVEEEIIQEEKALYAQKAEKMAFVFDGITIEKADEALIKLNELVETAQNQIAKISSQKDNITEVIADKYSREIELLNELIDASTNIDENKDTYVSSLTPSISYFESIINIGAELLGLVSPLSKDSKADSLDRYKFFSKRTTQQLQSYLNVILFNACRKKIKDEFNIVICDLYKHYWYISLYCTYLTRIYRNNTTPYIFIDEAQDLSLSEIELISKLNTKQDENGITEPIINAFGDVNQMISSHGIKSWSDIDFIETEHLLNENFRNPNQIVSFCNERLPFSMKEVGVDMEEVEIYPNALTAIKKSKYFDDIVYVVKNDYAKRDLMEELKNQDVLTQNIYTVKEVKGLEFKNVCVFDRGMTTNEKYIAYTRALAKLIVVEQLTKFVDDTEKLFVEGADTSDVALEEPVSGNS